MERLMNLNFLDRDTLRRGVYVLQILTVCFLVYSVLLSFQPTAVLLSSIFYNPYYPIPQVIGDVYAPLFFALLFGVRRTIALTFVLLIMGLWDLSTIPSGFGFIQFFTFMPQVKMLVAGIFIAVAFSNLSSQYERKQQEIEMREHNRRVALIKDLHDGAAKKITQALIHVRTNPPVDPEVVRFLDEALTELRETMTATDGLYDTRDQSKEDMPSVPTRTLSQLLDDYATVIQDRELTVACSPTQGEFPPLPECMSELINNAVKYARFGSTVSLTMTESDMAYGIRMENETMPKTDPSFGSNIGLEATSRTFIRLGAQFTTFNDGEHFTATISLPKRLTTGPQRQTPPPRVHNIFSCV